ncbi:restriction endonuclease [Rhizobium rhizogenes]|uniref:restriction endonuclease n=1 Tax=Rhizobium rhizogenes TaxID=359 RepID=UPI001375A6A1|nr:restriction endonuclease [Rhizobium rhizogenes]
MISKDKYIEILAAALQRITIPGADVQWNVKLGNRQFDVLATVTAGMHSILVGYEIKNKSRPISVDAIDAFVTKTRDAGLNKAVFVSTSGFQSGAIAAAKDHNIDLFGIELMPTGLPGIDQSSTYLVVSSPGAPPFDGLEVSVANENARTNCVESISVAYKDGSTIQLPDEQTQMTYYVERSKFQSGRSLGDVINAIASELVPLDQTREETIVVDELLTPPDEYFIKRGMAKEIRLSIKGITAKILWSNAQFELTSMSTMVRYTNLVSGVSTEVPAKSLPVGETSFTQGEFYFLYEPLRYFYCDRVDGDTAHIYLVESFQSGQLVQGLFTQSNSYSPFYMELRDRKTKERLSDRLRKLR